MNPAESTLPLVTVPARGQWQLPSADTVKTALEAVETPTEQVSLVLWLLDYGRHHKLTMAPLAETIRKDGSTLSRVFSGKYGAELDNICSEIEHFRRVETERAGFGETPIAPTRVMKRIGEFCDLARVSQTMAFLWGPNQSGKTTALEYYRDANNHGQTVYVRMPVGGSARMFMGALMRACGISERNAYEQMRDRAHRFFGPSVLLIVDEVHQAMIGRSLKTVTIELIRELHDLSRCGVVLCGTDVLPDMINDPRFTKFLGQIGNRGVLRMRIPSAPGKADVSAVCNAYGFPPAEGEAAEKVREIGRTAGIGALTKYLRMARKLATNRKQPVGWGHFLTTLATLATWARGEEEA